MQGASKCSFLVLSISQKLLGISTQNFTQNKAEVNKKRVIISVMNVCMLTNVVLQVCCKTFTFKEL